LIGKNKSATLSTLTHSLGKMAVFHVSIFLLNVCHSTANEYK